MPKFNFKQLPSNYFLENNKHVIEYTICIDTSSYYFTRIKSLWEDTLGEGCSVKLSEDLRTVSYKEISDRRSVRYSQEQLNFVFSDVIGWRNTTNESKDIIEYLTKTDNLVSTYQ